MLPVERGRGEWDSRSVDLRIQTLRCGMLVLGVRMLGEQSPLAVCKFQNWIEEWVFVGVGLPVVGAVDVGLRNELGVHRCCTMLALLSQPLP